MTKEIVKKAVAEAEKEAEQKQIDQIKGVVKSTLEKIKDLDEKIKELEDERRILKLDIEDLKEGRLDRIEERQQKDKKSKAVSVIVVEKEVHHHHDNWWYQPYVIKYVPYEPVKPTWPTPIWYTTTTTNTLGDTTQYMIGNNSTVVNSMDAVCFETTGSLTKNNVAGTYCLSDKTVHLR